MEWLEIESIKEKVELNIKRRDIEQNSFFLIKGKTGTDKLLAAYKLAQYINLPFFILDLKKEKIRGIFMNEFISFLSRFYYVKNNLPIDSQKILKLFEEIKDYITHPFTIVFYSIPIDLIEPVFSILDYLPKGSKMIFITDEDTKNKELFILEEKHIKKIKTIIEKSVLEFEKIYNFKREKNINFFSFFILPYFNEDILQKISDITKYEYNYLLNFIKNKDWFVLRTAKKYDDKNYFLSVIPEVKRSFKKYIREYFSEEQEKEILTKYAEIMEEKGYLKDAIKILVEIRNFSKLEQIVYRNMETLFLDFYLVQWIKGIISTIEEKNLKNYPSLYLTFAEIEKDKRNHKKALKIIKEIKEKTNDNKLVPHIDHLIVRIYYDIGMDEFVLKISNSYIYRNDISNILKARFYNFVGLIKTLLGDMEEAEKSFLEARALFMKEGDEASVAYTSIYLGNILRFFYGKLKEAIKFYEDFSKVFVPLNIFVQFQTGDTKSLMGDFKGAEENLRKIKFLYKFFPDYIRGVYDSFLEARILMRKKEFNSAISKFIESLEKNPGNPTDFYICLNLSLCYAFKNEMEKAYEYFNKSQQIYRYILDWERYEVQKIQGFLFLKEGKIDKAIKVFENLYYISNLSIEDKIFILYLYGRSLVINGKKEKGEKVLQEALDLCDKTEIKIFFKDLI